LGELMGINPSLYNTPPYSPFNVNAYLAQMYALNAGYQMPVQIPAPPAAVPAAAPLTPRVIRGVVPSEVRVIGIPEPPVSELKPEPPEPQIPDLKPEPEPQAEPEPIISETFGEPEYSEPETAPADEFVRVYQSTAKTPKSKKTAMPEIIESQRQEPQLSPPQIREQPRSAKYEKGGLLKNPYLRDIIKNNDGNQDNGVLAKPTPPAAPPPKIRVKKPARSVIPSPIDLENAKFPDILANFERKDGFETEDSGDMSHKTRHVMDAIFKQGGSNPFVKRELKDEDYE